MTTNWLELSKENELLKIRLQIMKQDIIKSRLEIIDRIKSKVIHGEPYIYTYEIGSYIMANDGLNTRLMESIDLMIHIQEELDKICYEHRRLERSDDYKEYDDMEKDAYNLKESEAEPQMPEDLKRRLTGEYTMMIKDYGGDFLKKKRYSYTAQKVRQFPRYRYQIKQLCSEMETDHRLLQMAKDDKSKGDGTSEWNNAELKSSEISEKIAENKNQ